VRISQLPHETRLAHSGLTDDRDDLPLASASALEGRS